MVMSIGDLLLGKKGQVEIVEIYEIRDRSDLYLFLDEETASLARDKLFKSTEIRPLYAVRFEDGMYARLYQPRSESEVDENGSIAFFTAEDIHAEFKARALEKLSQEEKEALGLAETE